MLVSAESQVPKLISREITLRNSNACDHNPPTLQTGGQTERQTTMAIPRYATLRAVKRDHSVRRQQRQAMLIACALPAHRHPPASQCSRWPNVNERTNQPTNKHDGSQWIGLYLLLEITRRTTFTLSPSWQSHCQSSCSSWMQNSVRCSVHNKHRHLLLLSPEADTHFTTARRYKAESIWLAGCILGWFTCLQTSHPCK